VRESRNFSPFSVIRPKSLSWDNTPEASSCESFPDEMTLFKLLRMFGKEILLSDIPSPSINPYNNVAVSAERSCG
jgi:hypothetical protein